MKTWKRYCTVIICVCVLFLTACGVQKETSDNGSMQNGPIVTGAVSYLGPEGTYTQEATEVFFGKDGDYRPQKTVEEAVDQLTEGICQYAVIPQENTIGGPVYDYLDELLANDTVSIVGEVELPIRQALLVSNGTNLTDIEIVYSHPQGISQGMVWLEENLPNAQIVEVSSTAEGAKIVAGAEEANCAAIASTGAASVYGLHVLAENIQQNENNKTRFYVLSEDAPQQNASDRMVFSATGAAEYLPGLLKIIEKNDLELVYIHDRAEKTTLGRYIYLIECKNAGFEDFQKLESVTELSLTYYGAFPVR